MIIVSSALLLLTGACFLLQWHSSACTIHGARALPLLAATRRGLLTAGAPTQPLVVLARCTAVVAGAPCGRARLRRGWRARCVLLRVRYRVTTEKYIICPLIYLISPLSKKKGA